MSGWREVWERGFATAVSSPILSRLVGRLAEWRLPPALLAPVIQTYSRLFGADLAEAAAPPRAYPTFNAFFTRRLRPGVRPVAEGPGVVVSPSDSRLDAIGPAPGDGQLEPVKGRAYSLEALLGSAEDAASFRGGVCATLYLSPAMYHRVHVPVDGRITGWRHVPGRLFPVNAPSVRSVPGLFARNERVVVFIDSVDHGRVAVVLVGAANVGRISLAFTELVTNEGRPAAAGVPPEPLPVCRGQDLGTFNLGSTVVLLVADATLLVAPGVVKGGLVRMGQALWRHGLAEVARRGGAG